MHADAEAPQSPRPWRPSRLDIAIFLPVALLGCWAIFLHTSLAEPFVDLMQEGEYLAPRLYLAKGAVYPLLIHGQIDYVPSRIAEALFGTRRLIAGTRFVNLSLCTAAALLFIASMIALARTRQAACGATLATLLVMALSIGRELDSLSASQGSPGLRDLFLIAATFSLLLAERAVRRKAILLFRALAGLVAGAGVFWAYNRGIIGVAGIAVFAACVAVLGPRRLDAIAPLCGLVVGLVLAVGCDRAMAPRHVANIVYWARHAEIWRQPLTRGQLLTDLPALAVVGAAIASGVALAAIRWRKNEGRSGLAVLAWSALICAATTQQILNRPDDPHIRMLFAWTMLLVWQIWSMAAPAGLNLNWPMLARRWWGVAATLAAIVLVDFYATRSVSRTMAQFGMRNLLLLARGLPDDRSLTPPDTLAVADLLRRADPACTYALNNAGGLYHLAGRVPCSATLYPIYAARDGERQVIADLRRARPNVVVIASDDWFNAIDNKPLAARTPELARWAGQAYPNARRIGRYRIAFIREGVQGRAP